MSNQTAQDAGYEFGKTFDPEFLMSDYVVEREALTWGAIGKFNFWSGYNTAKAEYINCC